MPVMTCVAVCTIFTWQEQVQRLSKGHWTIVLRIEPLLVVQCRRRIQSPYKDRLACDWCADERNEYLLVELLQLITKKIIDISIAGMWTVPQHMFFESAPLSKNSLFFLSSKGMANRISIVLRWGSMLLVITARIVATCLLCIRARPGATLCAIVAALILTAVLVIVPRLIGSRLHGTLNLRWENILQHRLGQVVFGQTRNVHSALQAVSPPKPPYRPGRSQLYLADLSCIWLICNEKQMHYDTTVGCDLKAPVKGGGIQQLDLVQGHCDRVTHCHSGLNLNMGKMNYHLGSQDPYWAIFLKSGQTFSEVGKFILFIINNKLQ